MTEKLLYTLDDYHTAKAAHEGQLERFNRYDGNNPDKYASDIRSARETLHRIEVYLKRHGVLPVTEREAITLRLDADHPNAQSKQIVALDGRRYQKRFEPVSRSNSGKTVREWAHAWHEVK